MERNRTGKPAGILRNCARYIPSEPEGKPPSFADRLARLHDLLADYNAVGITSIVDGNTDQEGLELYRTLLARNALACRTFMAFGVDAQVPLEKIQAAIRDAAPGYQHNNML